LTDPIKVLQDFLEAVNARENPERPAWVLAGKAALYRAMLQAIVGDITFAGDPRTIEAVTLALETQRKALTDA